MVQIASLMMLASGMAHAVVNAILKSGKDKMSSRALIDGFSALLMAPAAFFNPLPHGAWGWLAASWVTHLVYLVCLIRAFERADMTVAYPILRGVAPASPLVVMRPEDLARSGQTTIADALRALPANFGGGAGESFPRRP